MTRESAIQLLREELDKHKLTDWHIRIASNTRMSYLGMTLFKDKCIILNTHHLDIHPDPEILNTIRHEVAHALVGPGHGHNFTWENKAREVGCTSVAPCSHLELSAELIDAIRSGAQIEVTYETEIIHRPKYQITRLQDKCPTCGKVAKTKSERTIELKLHDEKWIHLECGHLIVKKIPKGTPFRSITFDGDKECNHKWNANGCHVCGAKRPYPFQVDGMHFIETALAVNKGAAIFDEMGLGKTIQALGYLKFHSESFPVLFVVKSAIKFNWAKEILRLLGDEFVPQIISSSKDIVIPRLKCYICSYDIFVFKTRKGKNGQTITQGFDFNKFIERGIKTVILDECQQIKNPDAGRTQAIRKLVRDMQVIGLSGTPWKNRGSEFFTILNFLAPMKFFSFEQFKQRWVRYYFDGKYTKEGGIYDVQRFKEYIKDIAIRREVNDVLKELPDVNRTLLHAELNKIEQSTYDEEEESFAKWYNDLILSGEENSSSMNILAKMQRMRHLTGLAKIPATEAYIEEFFEDTDKKLVVFVHHKDVGEILYENAKKEYQDIKVMKLTGEQTALERFNIQEEFNKTERTLLIASTLAAGEGMNLQTCGDAIMHERQWNPMNEDQAAPGRFRRIGSAYKQVNITFPTASGTIDEIMAGIVERKRLQFHEAMNRGEAPQWNQANMAKEIADAIVNKWKKRKKKTA